MNRLEAKGAMRNGLKVTHSTFTVGEWIRQEGNVIICANGYDMPSQHWWLNRADCAAYDDNWSIFKDVTEVKETDSATTGAISISAGLASIEELQNNIDTLLREQLIATLKELKQGHIVKHVKENGIPSRVILSKEFDVIEIKEIFNKFAEVSISSWIDKPTIVFLWDNAGMKKISVT